MRHKLRPFKVRQNLRKNFGKKSSYERKGGKP